MYYRKEINISVKKSYRRIFVASDRDPPGKVAPRVLLDVDDVVLGEDAIAHAVEADAAGQTVREDLASGSTNV